MNTYFKATRPDGTDFWTGAVDYAAALGGDPITLPVVRDPWCGTSDVLHASTVPTEALIGGSWPCRLFEVTGTPAAEGGYERGFFSLTVVREVDAYRALGPQGEQVAALIDRAGRLTVGETEKLAAAWVAFRTTVRGAAWDAARTAAWDADRTTVRDAVWAAVWVAVRASARASARATARDAAIALVVSDLISKEHYDLLTGPWAQVIGSTHPDDKSRMVLK